jgi:hypothetical protein
VRARAHLPPVIKLPKELAKEHKVSREQTLQCEPPRLSLGYRNTYWLQECILAEVVLSIMLPIGQQYTLDLHDRS